ncbi:MAG: hypothetical protein JWQ27_2441 [Ferruginibacter sp.]|nr:hypothetical protein [Ferruginibacter sp.]
MHNFKGNVYLGHTLAAGLQIMQRSGSPLVERRNKKPCICRVGIYNPFPILFMSSSNGSGIFLSWARTIR